MSAMLSSFIYRSVKASKRKGKKHHLNLAIRRAQSPPSPASFMSPEIMDINEKSVAPMGKNSSPLIQVEEESFESYDSRYDMEYIRSNGNPMLLELTIPNEPLIDWFSHDTLRGEARHAERGNHESLNGVVCVNGVGYDGREAFVFSSDDAVNQLDETMESSSTEDLHKQVVAIIPRKPAPAPIRIPSAAIHRPKVYIQRSANLSHTEVITNPQPPAAQSRLESPISPEDISALSGTTLARALIANSFILSSDVRVSRYRSGMSANIRQDSAILPRGENPFLNSPYWRDKRISSGDIILTPNSGRDSSVPPVPPLPSSDSSLYLKGPRSARTSGAGSEIRDKSRRQSGAELTRNASGSSLRSLHTSGSELPSVVRSSSTTTSERPTSRRISRILELPSPVSSGPGAPVKSNTPSPDDIHNASPSVSPLSKQTHSDEETAPLDYDVPTPSPEPQSRPRRHSQSDTSLSPGSAQSMSIVNVLDDYLFISSADSRSALSPMASESSASMTAPTPYRTAPKRASKKRKEHKMGLNANSSSLAAAGKGRVGWVQRKKSESRIHPSPQDGSKSKLLPIGERPWSLLLPQTPLTPGFIPTTGSPLRLNVGTPSTSPSAVSPSIHFLPGPETPIESPDFLDDMFAPMPRGIFSTQRSGSTPDPITIIRESKDISDFNITVSEEDGSSDGTTPSTGSGHQTFPETPHAFSPLWSASTAGGSPRALQMPSLSATSSLVFVPGHSPRSASLSGTMHISQPSLAQKVLLSRAITVSGHKAASDASKLRALKEFTEPSRQTSASSSLSGNSSSESLQDNVDAIQPSPSSTLSFPIPPMSIVSPSLSQTSLDDSGAQSSPAPPTPAPLPNVSQSSSVSSSSAPSISLSTPSLYPSPRRPLPQIVPNRSIQPSLASTSARVVSPAVTPQTDVPHPPSVPSFIQMSTPSQPRFTPEVFSAHSSLTPSFIAPPPYHAVVNNSHLETQAHSQIPAMGSLPNINESESDRVSGSNRRARVRPPLPVGPRKPSTGQLAPSRERNGSVSSVGSSTMNRGSFGSDSLRKIMAQSSSPKFQNPAPKFRGYTMEAAKWTFTSHQLQTIVSRAIKQSAEAASVRLLRLETLDIDIPEEMHRLEMQKMDLKMRYKSLTRKRWNLLGSLTAHVGGSEVVDSATALRTLEELAEISTSLDHLAEELHAVTQQLANLKSLGDVHSASALAMALRKLNASFLKQVAETQALRQQVSSLESERDEAWNQAEGVAQEYDELIDRYGDDFQMSGASKSPSSRRSSRVTAVRKSSIRASKAGLRSVSMRRSYRSSVSSSRHGHRGSELLLFPVTDDVPPVPPMPYRNILGISTTDLPNRSSMAASTSTPSSGTRAMIRAQEELYDLLVSMSVTKEGRPRPLSLTSPSSPSKHMYYSRPLSDITTPGFGTSSMPGSARANRLYADNSDAMLAATMSIISD